MFHRAASFGGAEFGISDDEKNKVVMSAMKNGPKFRLLLQGKIVTELPSSAKLIQ